VTKSSRVSKADWLARALDVLEEVGIDGVRIERLARDLGVAKSGFYWHFRDRPDLLQQMLKYWSDEFTESVLISPKTRQGSASDRLFNAMEMIEEQDLSKFDLAFRAWAEHDPFARRAIRRVYQRRLSFVTELFQHLGFRGQELEMRARLFVVYHSWQQTYSPKDTKAKRAAMRKLRHALLVKK
jgi:AcrR family transcriptional regulator